LHVLAHRATVSDMFLVVACSECAALRCGTLCRQNCVLLLCVLTLSANNWKFACSRALTESALSPVYTTGESPKTASVAEFGDYYSATIVARVYRALGDIRLFIYRYTNARIDW